MAMANQSEESRSDRRRNEGRAAAGRTLGEINSGIGRIWDLGRNNVVAWLPAKDCIEVLVAPCYVVLDRATQYERVTHGNRFMGRGSFATVSRLLGVKPQRIDLEGNVGTGQGEIPWQRVEEVIRRYAISQTLNRAVILFDIVGFSLRSHVEQVSQLNSLEVSINVAHRCMRELRMPIDLARSSTGDGYYVWNRNKGVEADLNLNFLLMLILADNAVARELGTANLVPELRSCFTVGSHFSFYQVEGLIRGGGDYIVGDATIELARLAAKTLPGQILFGEFNRPSSERGASIDAPGFMMNVQQRLDDMEGADLDHGRVDNIRCYLTGVPGDGDQFLINKYDIVDKHGFHHAAYNAKINIYRGDEPPIFLGTQTEDLADFGTNRRYESIPAAPAPWDHPR